MVCRYCKLVSKWPISFSVSGPRLDSVESFFIFYFFVPPLPPPPPPPPPPPSLSARLQVLAWVQSPPDPNFCITLFLFFPSFSPLLHFFPLLFLPSFNVILPFPLPFFLFFFLLYFPILLLLLVSFFSSPFCCFSFPLFLK